MSILEKNLQQLISKNSTLAVKLHAIYTNERYDVYADETDPLNVNVYDKERKEFLYVNKPLDEVTERYREIMAKKSRYPLLFFYGIANGLLVKMFTNLDKYAVVVEPNLELIYIALSLFDFAKEIEENRLHIFYEPDIDFHGLMTVLKHKDVKTFLKLYDLEINNSYYDFYQDQILEVNRTFIKNISHVIHSEGNDANDSLIGLNHHLKHLPAMIRSYTFESLVANVNTKNAVIVSTGPSLAKQLPLLKEYREYMTILCIDASLPILQKEGIAPDIVFSLERVEPTAKFYEELDKELLKDTIFSPTSIVHPKTLQNLKGMRQSISMRPFGYTKAFKLNKWGYIGIGMSAANMAMDFAYVAKFKKIALIGQDLAFGEDGKTHSKGALYGEEETQYKKDTLKIKGYYGGEVLTSKVWNMFLNFFVHDIYEIKEKENVDIYNCTEGGAYIEGAEHIPFADFLEKLDTSVKKEAIMCEKVSAQKQAHYIHRSKKLLNLYIARIEWIKQEVERVFLQVMEKIELLETLNREDDLEKIDFDSMIAVINEIDKIKDIYETDRVLVKFGNITNPIILNAELELARIMVTESNTDDEKKVKMIDWIYEHKSWLFFLAGALENILFIMKDNQDLKEEENS